MKFQNAPNSPRAMMEETIQEDIQKTVISGNGRESHENDSNKSPNMQTIEPIYGNFKLREFFI